MIPHRLPILALPYPQILHPGLVLSIPVPQTTCLGLLRTALQERKELDAQEARASETVPTSKQAQANAQRPVLILCVAKQSAEVGEIPPDSLDGLHTWGCVARVLRLVNSPASEECRLQISGLMRAKIGRPVLAAEPVVANITVVELRAFPQDLTAAAPKDETPGVRAMRKSAKRLVELMGRASIPTHAASPNSVVARVPLLPPPLLKRVTLLLREFDQMSSGMLADLLVGALGLSLIHI